MKKQLAILFVLITFFGRSQNFEYRVLLEGIGDNREFFNDYGFPQTILGARAAFETGVKSDNHRISGGLSYLLEFGSDIDAMKPKLTLYYQFSDPKKEFFFGAFPRKNKIDFPLAMLTDTFLYYRPNIEGMYGVAKWDWGYQSGFVDWLSRQTDVKREIFTAGFSGEIYFKNFFIQDYILMSHNASAAIRLTNDYIKDYLGFALQAGVRTSEKQAFNGYIKAGILTSAFRQRAVTNGYVAGSSFFAEAKGHFKNYALKSVLSTGESHNFAYGDNFYRAKNYWRTDAIWYFINHENVKGTFNFAFHVIDWEELNFQQQLSVVYLFGK